jgi:alkylation response protein AidB-like acyl-CoA dehydrogenase
MTDPAMFSLSDEHKMIRDAARDFAQKEIAPNAAEFDESGEFPHATIKKMGGLGFMGLEIPEQYGGAGMDTLAYVLALEEICKADASHGVIMSVNNSLYCHDIMKFGTEEQKQKYVVPIASGKAIGAYPLTANTHSHLHRRSPHCWQSRYINQLVSFLPIQARVGDFTEMFLDRLQGLLGHGALL